MSKLIIGTLLYGGKCVYDVPAQIETQEQFESLIYDFYFNPARREELQGQPKLLGFSGPMFNGYKYLASTGEKVTIIRYEKPGKC